MSLKKNLTINMPQMAIQALSENWLFKELGDNHWNMICQGLGTKSYDLKNDTGERLYATFVRIRISSDGSLRSFRENQNADVEGSLSRFGDSMYFSDMKFTTDTAIINAELMTTFSIRDKVDNTSLSKAEPDGVINSVENQTSFPSFGNEYRLAKKRVLKSLSYGPYNFKVDDSEVLYSTKYTLNPFYDINGVNLLYFAAYPIINDVCEARYFNSLGSDEAWEQNYYTAYKDVLYYANCNLEDSIVYELLSTEKLSSTEVKNSSLLRRESDGEIIAKIFSIKRKIL